MHIADSSVLEPRCEPLHICSLGTSLSAVGVTRATHCSCLLLPGFASVSAFLKVLGFSSLPCSSSISQVWHNLRLSLQRVPAGPYQTRRGAAELDPALTSNKCELSQPQSRRLTRGFSACTCAAARLQRRASRGPAPTKRAMDAWGWICQRRLSEVLHMWQVPSSACPSSPAAHIEPLSDVLQAPGARQKLLDRLAEAEAQQEASRGRGRCLPPCQPQAAWGPSWDASKDETAENGAFPERGVERVGLTGMQMGIGVYRPEWLRTSAPNILLLEPEQHHS